MSDYNYKRTCFDCGSEWDGFGGVCNQCRLIQAQKEANKIASDNYNSSGSGGGGYSGGGGSLPAPVNWALRIFIFFMMIANDFALPKFIWAVASAMAKFAWEVFSGLFSILV